MKESIPTSPHQTETMHELVVNRMGDCLVVVLPNDLGPQTLDQVRASIKRVGTHVTGVILDCAGLEVLDLEDHQCLQQLRRMFSLLGARTVLLGLKPGVVAALISLGCDGEGLEGVLGMEQALSLARKNRIS